MKNRRTSNRRASNRSGRRAGEQTADALSADDKLAATLVWELPGHTRCWTMRRDGQIVAYVTRGPATISIEIFKEDKEAQAQTERWRTELG